MSTGETKFHESRRAFFIMREPKLNIIKGDFPILLIEDVGDSNSHIQMLQKYKLDQESINKHLVKSPRGYYMNGELCLYQGFNMIAGTLWQLEPQNYSMVQIYLPELCERFNLNDDSNMYLGVRVGRVGEVWEKINKTTVGNFMHMR